MNHLEVARSTHHLFYLQNPIGEWIGGVHFPKRPGADGHQLTRPLGGARTEENQFVPSSAAEFFAKRVHHPLGAAVLPRRNANEKRATCAIRIAPTSLASAQADGLPLTSFEVYAASTVKSQ